MIVSSVPRKRYRNLILVLLLLLLATPVAAQQFEVNLEVSTTSGIGYNLLAGMAQGRSICSSGTAATFLPQFDHLRQ